MRKKADGKLLVGLDIGTAKIAVVVLELLPDQTLEILGVGHYVSSGMKKGVIVNIDTLSQAVHHAIESAELMSGCQIHSVFTAISGSHIKSYFANGVVEISNGKVSATDIDNVLFALKTLYIPPEQKILHTIPEEYVIDNQSGIQDPLSMSGVRLELKANLVTCSISIAQNIINTIRRQSLGVDDIILSALASSLAVLTNDEKQLGVCVLDIGAGTTDVAVYRNGVMVYAFSLPVAGEQVTNDIAVALKTAIKTAEQLKLKYGVADRERVNAIDKINFLPLGAAHERQIKQLDLVDIMQPRLEEIFKLVQTELQKNNFGANLIAGYVLTGGTTNTPAILSIASKVLQGAVRIGRTQGILGSTEFINNPIYATALGLGLWGGKVEQMHKLFSNDKSKVVIKTNGVFDRIVHWFKGNF